MAGEETVQLRDVCVKIGSGATPRGGKEAYKGGATSLIRSQNIYNEGFHRDGLVYIDDDQSAELRNVEVKPNDVLLNITGDSVARCCQVAEDVLPARVNQHVAIIRPQPKSLDARFLRYVLVSHEYQSRLLALASAGATRPALTKSMIEELDIPSPPLAEQKAIAAVLGALDDKIELNRRMNATLEAMARALFQSWFVDFDPVRAKLDGRVPTGMDAETAALFPDSFEHGVDSGIHPKGWIKTTIGDEVIFQTGFSFQSEFFTETPPGIRLARGMNVKEGEFFWSNQSRYWPQVTPDIEQYLLRVGDVLIGMDGSKVGKNWVRVRAADLPCLLVQRVARLREADSIGQNFIALLIGSTTFRDFVEAVKTGTSIPHISGGQIKGYSFLRPPCDDNRIFQRFESLVGPMTAQADKNHAEAEILSSVRDTLLPKLLSGELSVAEIEKEVVV